jgi:uncharacterized SAM-binding protein YcdF (DUF218 family)
MNWDRIRHARRWVKIVAAVLVLFVVLTARLFIWPDTNAPVHSDAIVVLGGSGPRAPEGVLLAEQGYAPMLIFSIYKGEHCVPSTRTEIITCFVANPASTRGEAHNIARLAAQYHLHRIIVVATTPQATRARLRVGRCFSGQILVVGVSPVGVRGWISEVVYEWPALIKALVLQPTC